MNEEMQTLRRELTLRSIFDRLWILAVLGGLIAAFTSINSEFSPYVYWPYLVPAVVALIALAALAFGDVSKSTRQALAALLALTGAWLILGPWLSGFANLELMPATRASVLAGGIIESVDSGGLEATEAIVARAFEASSVNTVTLTGAGVGGVMLLLGGIGNWLACRKVASQTQEAVSDRLGITKEKLYTEPGQAVYLQSEAVPELGEKAS
jgi:hypothetical protein